MHSNHKRLPGTSDSETMLVSNIYIYTHIYIYVCLVFTVTSLPIHQNNIICPSSRTFCRILFTMWKFPGVVDCFVCVCVCNCFDSYGPRQATVKYGLPLQQFITQLATIAKQLQMPSRYQRRWNHVSSNIYISVCSVFTMTIPPIHTNNIISPSSGAFCRVLNIMWRFPGVVDCFVMVCNCFDSCLPWKQLPNNSLAISNSYTTIGSHGNCKCLQVPATLRPC